MEQNQTIIVLLVLVVALLLINFGFNALGITGQSKLPVTISPGPGEEQLGSGGSIGGGGSTTINANACNADGKCETKTLSIQANGAPGTTLFSTDADGSLIIQPDSRYTRIVGTLNTTNLLVNGVSINYLDPTSCEFKTVNAGPYLDFLNFSCNPNSQVVGTVTFFGCSNVESQRAVSSSNNNNSFPSEIGYVCENKQTGAWRKPDYLLGYCCNIKNTSQTQSAQGSSTTISIDKSGKVTTTTS